MKKFKYSLICIAALMILTMAFINSKTKEGNLENFTKSDIESLTLVNNQDFNLSLKLSSIDQIVEETKTLQHNLYTGVDEKGVLQYKNVFYYVDEETNTYFDLYYDELGKLIFADITHYRGPLYEMYFENDKILYTEVGPFTTESDVFIKGGLEEINTAIAKDEKYSFVLEDIDLCLKYAYQPVVMVSNYGQAENEDLTDYSVEMLAYNENLSYIEYPRIVGLEDKEKEEKINKILEEQVLTGAKNALTNDNFVDFNVEGVSYKYTTTIGLCNNDIASFNYYFYAWDNLNDDTFGAQGYTSRNYGVTIDMKTGEKIELSDFLIIDNRLIESNDGTGIETDYNAEWPQFHNFKDAFRVSDSEENVDAFHMSSYEQTLETLRDEKGETIWYIDSDKNIEFTWSGPVKIPYTQLEEIIYPKYLGILQG